MFMSSRIGCAGVLGMYGPGVGLLQIVGGGPVGLVRLAAVGVLLAAPVIEPVHDELVGAYAGLRVQGHAVDLSESVAWSAVGRSIA